MACTPDDELISLLSSEGDSSIRSAGMQYILGLTGDLKGVEHILGNKKYLPALRNISNENNDIGRMACKALINISSYECGASALTDMDEFFQWLVDGLDCKAPFIDLKCHIMSNFTRHSAQSEELSSWFKSHDCSLKKLMDLFCLLDSDLTAKYCHLASVFANLTQTPHGQRLFLNKRTSFIKNLVPYTTYADSDIRRMGVARTLRNCCFNLEYHSWLIEDLNILPELLLPLAGPEDLDEDEMEQLPVELQYLGEDKQRETNPMIRRLLIESIIKLCATKQIRMRIKGSGTYYIMRELHKWEKDAAVIKTCEDLVDILISDEPEVGMDNLMEVKIPEDVEEQLGKQQIYPEDEANVVLS